MKVVLLKPTPRELPTMGIVVEPGVPVDVPKSLADGLLDQPDVWAKHDPKTTSDSEDD